MTRLWVGCLALLACACVARRPLPVRYDLDGTPIRTNSQSRLNAMINVAPIQAPSWLRSTALVYRLYYETPAKLRAYSQSEWTAPPGEMLTLRLRELISEINDGFTLTRPSQDASSYRLEVTLENFTQIFASLDHSQCVVTLNATVVQPGERVVAQQTFHAEASAPSADAAGAVTGLVAAADADFQQILQWLRSTLLTHQAAATTQPTSPTR
jgi:cholesterol transport system auxiliary component